MINMGKYAYPILPRTGFCNMLNPWARAYLWARDNGASMLAPNWVKLLRIGPWLRGERDKRYYFGMITNDGYISGLKKRLILLRHAKINETDIRDKVRECVVIFSGQRNDLLDFPHQARALNGELNRIAAPTIKSRLRELPQKFIGVHIRRGDFKIIGQTLPEDYYCTAISHAIKLQGNIPIIVCSDASETELSYLRQFSNLYVQENNPSLLDLLTLSRASCLVCTNGSSFSEWAAFLGGMQSIWSRDGRTINVDKFDSEVIFI